MLYLQGRILHTTFGLISPTCVRNGLSYLKSHSFGLVDLAPKFPPRENTRIYFFTKKYDKFGRFKFMLGIKEPKLVGRNQEIQN